MHCSDQVDWSTIQRISVIDDWKGFFKHFGISTLEIGFAIKTKNPFLLIGGAMHFAASVKACFNSRPTYIEKLSDFLSIESQSQILSLNNISNSCSISSISNSLSVKNF